MTVAQPDFILIVNGAGTAFQNLGTDGGNYTIQQGSSPTHYEFIGNADPELSYYQSKLADTANMPWLEPATNPGGTGLEAINFALKFRLTGLTNPGGEGDSIIKPTTSAFGRGLSVAAFGPSGGGNFNLEVEVNASVGTLVTYENLSFNTDYRVIGSFDVTTPTAAQLRVKLDNAAIDTPATENFNTQTLDNAWPRIGRRFDFTNSRGWTGRLYYFVFQRGGTFWSATDINDIATSRTAITGWPGGGGGPALPIPQMVPRPNVLLRM